ncbi:importin-4-like [Dendronephthya gigantea]|uniref:importin-4-like n=1 Tax=Dendronephthya gigantea TaxID=151771 RepID=UPI00106B9515|nr:importin-4-like [Dendronephthya gigantea]
MAAELEEILGRLLVPDNAIIKQATAELRAFFQNPTDQIVPILVAVLSSSQSPQARQYAAILLRRRVVKQWLKLNLELRNSLKPTVLQVLVRETERIVCHSTAQIIGAIAKHELPNEQWPQLFQFLNEYIKSPQPGHREMAMYVLSIITETVGEQLRPHFPALFHIFSKTLEDQENENISFYTVRSITNLVIYLGEDEINLLRPLIPKIIVIIKNLVQTDEDKACECMDVFDELVDSEVGIVIPHVKSLVEFCLYIAMNTELGDSSRVKALHFISWIIRVKSKVILKNKLLSPILSVVFPIMATRGEEDVADGDCEDEEDTESLTEAEDSRPNAVAAQVVDVLALHLAPEKLFPPLMQLVEPALTHSNPYHRKAALISLAVLAEGCADFVQEKHLQTVLHVVCQALSDHHIVVRNAALFALGQFAEYLQPDISKFAAIILPLLFDYLGQAVGKSDPPGISRTYYALETFCENLGEGILPYLPALMEQLLTTLSTPQPERIKGLAVSAVGAAASAAGKEMLPYFPNLIEILKSYICNPVFDGSQIQAQCIDTVGMLARVMGREHFYPIAEEWIKISLELIERLNDPDVRRCVYGLFASLSTFLKQDMATYLPAILTHILNTLRSTDGFVTYYNGEGDPTFLIEDENIEEEQGDDSDDDSVAGYTVENAYMDEKEDACNAVGEIAENTQAAFLRFMDETINEVLKLLQFPHTGVRKGSVTSMSQLCRSLHSILNNINENKTFLFGVVNNYVATMITMINQDKDRTVVMAILSSMEEMLKSMKQEALQGPGNFEGICAALKNVLMSKTRCQDNDDEDIDGENQEQAELDATLIEHAGDVIPKLATAAPGHEFVAYFASLLPWFLKRMKSALVSDRSFSVGTVAEIILAMELRIVPFVPHLYPVFMKLLNDEDDEVRGNTSYALGVLAAYGGDPVFVHYPEILEGLFFLLKREHEVRVVDNICAAVCRMICANISKVPMEQTFPVLLQCLPLKADFEENTTVYSCIVQLFNSEHPEVTQNIVPIIKIISQVIATSTITEETNKQTSAGSNNDERA